MSESTETLVHTAGDREAQDGLEQYDLTYVARIADPERTLYTAFELGEAKRFLGRRPRQLPGVFLFKNGETEGEFRPRAQRPPGLRIPPVRRSARTP